MNYIERIQNSTGGMVHTTTEIAGIIQKFYGALYLVKHKGNQDSELERIGKIEEFLKVCPKYQKISYLP